MSTRDEASNKFANQKNPHHVQYWKCRGYSEDEAKDCASAGRDVVVRSRVVASRGIRSTTAPPCAADQCMDWNIRNKTSRVAKKEGQLLLRGDESSRAFSAVSEQNQVIAPMYLSILLDTSGSMSGASISNVMDQSVKILNTVSKFDSRASVFYFDTTVRQVIKRMSVKDINQKRLKEQAQADARRGGQTALYDAILTGLDNLKDYHTSTKSNKPDMHYFLLAFTDGGDNVSNHNLKAVSDALTDSGLPNLFRFFIISAGVEREVSQRLDSLVHGKDHCRHLPVNSTSAADLNKAFMEFVTSMEEILTVKITSKGNGSRPAMPQIMQGISRHLNLHNNRGTNGNNNLRIEDATGIENGRRGRSSSVNRQRGRSTSRSSNQVHQGQGRSISMDPRGTGKKGSSKPHR